MVGGKVVYGAGDFAHLDAGAPPPAMPAWSPVRTFGGYAAWADQPVAAHAMQTACGCASRCQVRGHDHAAAWGARIPIGDLRAFWGALGCACWAV